MNFLKHIHDWRTNNMAITMEKLTELSRSAYCSKPKHLTTTQLLESAGFCTRVAGMIKDSGR